MSQANENTLPPMPGANSAPAPLSLEAYAEGVRRGDRAILARAITLIESRKREHQALAQDLLQMLQPETGRAIRLGITGAPGVGKSTLIDRLGLNLLARGHKVAVLAVDPTSTRTGGSILADKIRMTRLAADPRAYIRPSPTGGTLGGVTRTTRETMALCEAASFDVIIVETVGVGQSETAIAGMVDFFLVLLEPGAGDELQGLKKGVLELADMIAINKAEGDNAPRAAVTANEYRAALHILQPRIPEWKVPVITISGLKNEGLDTLWAKIEHHRALLSASGALAAKRREQAVAWMHDLIADRLQAWLRDDPRIAARLKALEGKVRAGACLPVRAADEITRIMGLE